MVTAVEDEGEDNAEEEMTAAQGKKRARDLEEESEFVFQKRARQNHARGSRGRSLEGLGRVGGNIQSRPLIIDSDEDAGEDDDNVGVLRGAGGEDDAPFI